MNNLAKVLDSIIPTIHWPPGHVPFYQAVVAENEALKARIDALEMLVNTPESPVEPTPVPSSLVIEQASVFGEGGDPEGAELAPAPVEATVDTPEQPSELDEPNAAGQELKPFPDLLPASPDPEPAAPASPTADE